MAPTPPLIKAAKDRNIVDCRQLIETGEANLNADRNWIGSTALHLASNKGYLDVVRLLLTEGADMTIADDYGSTALHEASSRGRLDVANCLRKWPCSMAIMGLQ